MSNNLLKVIWICHFTNSEVQKSLPLVQPVPQCAPWITELIEVFKKTDSVDLYIISYHKWLKKDVSVIIDGIHYYFFKSGMPLIHRHWPAIFKFDYWSDFYFERRKIKRIVDDIQPDIINLHGIENPYYSSSIFDLKAYPVLITIQGLFSFSNSITNTYKDKVTIKTEQKIIREFNHFGIRVKFLADYLQSLNPKVIFYWYKYPFKRSASLAIDSKAKDYDIVFFAKLSKDKGIEDLISSIEIAKRKHPTISVKIIGTTKEPYRTILSKKVSDLGLQGNIEFLGFLATQEELHQWVSKARICVLPTYNDILPGTIIESMFLKVPVIAYAANGVVDLNFEDENIRLVETGNIQELANQISFLLENNNFREKLSNKAYQFALQNFDNENEANKLIRAYKSVIQYYKTAHNESDK